MASIIFGPVKFMNVFGRVFSNFETFQFKLLWEWEQDPVIPSVCKYFHAWQPEKTEEVDDEPLMLRYYRGDRKLVDDDDDDED